MEHFEYVVKSNKDFDKTIEAIDAELKKLNLKLLLVLTFMRTFWQKD
ncbi:hypothetical protein [Tepidibacillus marianensis]